MAIRIITAVLSLIMLTVVLYVTEVTWGTIIDQMLFAFMQIPTNADPSITGPDRKSVV